MSSPSRRRSTFPVTRPSPCGRASATTTCRSASRSWPRATATTLPSRPPTPSSRPAPGTTAGRWRSRPARNMIAAASPCEILLQRNIYQMPTIHTHGFAGPSAQWKPEILPLAEKRRLVLYDVRGHGQTGVPENPEAYSLPAFAADLAALLKAIGLERAHVGGVSMGGMITAQFAVDYPQMCASVLLCDTTCGNAAIGGMEQAEGLAAEWERRLVIGMGLLAESARAVGLEATLRRERVWKEANDPHLAESPYTFEGDL